MAFNPIRDLNPTERNRAISQLGGATEEEIYSLSNSLRVTSARTSALVDQLRRNNNSLSRELSKINDLDRRLRRVIPIIPGADSAAGNIFPEMFEESGEGDGGIPIPPKVKIPKLKFPRFPRLPSIPPIPVTSPQTQTQTQAQTQAQTQTQTQQQGQRQRTRVGQGSRPLGETTRRQGEAEAEPELQPGFSFPIVLEGAKLFADDFARRYRNFTKKFSEATSFLDPILGPIENFLKGPKGGGAMTAIDMSLMALPQGRLFAGSLGLAKLLQRTPNLFKKFYGKGAPLIVPKRTSTYGAPIGPQPASAISKVKVPEVVKKIPTPPSIAAPYEEIAKSLPTATGARLGGQSVVKRGPLLQQFDRGGLFRRGTPATLEERALRQFLEDSGLSARAARLSDPKYIPQSPGEVAARFDVLKELELADKAFGSIVGGGTRIPKKMVVQPSKVQIRSFFDDIASGQKTIGNNTIAEIVGLNDPELRKRFLYYLRQAPKGQKQQSEGFLNKIAKGLELLPNGTQDDKNVAIQTIMRFLRPSTPGARDSRKFLFDKLKQADKFADDVPFEDFLTKGEAEQLRIPQIEKMLNEMFDKNINSSIIGKPGSTDIASLNIDTSVEIQEIYYIS